MPGQAGSMDAVERRRRLVELMVMLTPEELSAAYGYVLALSYPRSAPVAVACQVCGRPMPVCVCRRGVGRERTQCDSEDGP